MIVWFTATAGIASVGVVLMMAAVFTLDTLHFIGIRDSFLKVMGRK